MMASSSYHPKMEPLEISTGPSTSAQPAVAVEQPSTEAGPTEEPEEQQQTTSEALKETLGSTKNMYPFKALVSQDATTQAKHTALVQLLMQIVMFFRALIPFMAPRKGQVLVEEQQKAEQQKIAQAQASKPEQPLA